MQLEGNRSNTQSTLGLNLIGSLIQSAAIWAVFLLLIPRLLMRFEMFAAIPTFATVRWSEIGLLIFMACSTIFLLSLWSIVWLGQGTPWPWDRSTNFVVAGPYRYVRNPMVIAGLGQGVASALILGSYLCLIYVLIGAVIWNFVLRPMEEADLANRFGKLYVGYFQSVSAWIPNLHPYRLMILQGEPELADETLSHQ